jgi:isocitrate dehydrogenase
MEDGVHTYDIFKEGTSKQKVGTKEFGDAVVARLGKMPQTLKPVKYSSAPPQAEHAAEAERPAAKVALDGIDVYIAWKTLDPNALAKTAGRANGDGLELTMIDNRGVKVWPDGMSETLCTDSFRCRFSSKNGTTAKHTVALLNRVLDQGLEIVKTETLRTYNGKAGYTLAQGQ